MKEAGLIVADSMVVHNNLRKLDGEKAIQWLIGNNQKIDAIFCANDTTALSAIIYLKKQGIKIPDDILIMGFSNEPFSEVTSPSISTVKQPGFLMGQKAAELTIQQINAKNRLQNFETIIMPTELIIRESSVNKSGVK